MNKMPIKKNNKLLEQARELRRAMTSIFSNVRNIPTHKVDVKEGTLLSDIIGGGETWVNSFHHQAVDKLGAGIEAAAISEDGVVEAIVMPDKKFVLAVQWHPEMMFDSEKQQKIFQKFVKACC